MSIIYYSYVTSLSDLSIVVNVTTIASEVSRLLILTTLHISPVNHETRQIIAKAKHLTTRDALMPRRHISAVNQLNSLLKPAWRRARKAGCLVCFLGTYRQPSGLHPGFVPVRCIFRGSLFEYHHNRTIWILLWLCKSGWPLGTVQV